MSRSSLAILALLAFVASSCGAAREAGRVGMERDQTDITYGFTASSAARARVSGIPSAALGGNELGPLVTPQPTFSPIFRSNTPKAGPCPTADPSTVVSSRAPTEVSQRPLEGTYVWRASGSVSLSGSKVSLPYIFGHYVRRIKGFSDSFPQTPGAPQGDSFTYETLDPTIVGAEELVHWQVKTEPRSAQDPEGGLVIKEVDGASTDGKPHQTYFKASTTGLLMVPFPVKAGQTWTSVSFDISRGHSLQLNAQVLKREVLDVCGALIEGWHVHATMNDQGATGTLDYLIATQYGGQIVSLAIDGAFLGFDYSKAKEHTGQLNPGPLPSYLR